MVEADRNNRAYRRALTLGLTLAEIFVLILFVLLLAFAAFYERERDELSRIPQLKLELEKVSSSLRKATATSEDLTRKNEYLEHRFAVSSDRFDDFFHELSLCRAEETKLQNQIAQVNRHTPTDLSKCENGLAESNQENERITGQNQNLREKLAALGNGTELPPCWPTPEGKIKYSFNVVLSDSGVLILDNPPHKDEERRVLSGVLLGENLDGQSYLNTTSNAFGWARAHKCGIFVRVVDKTGWGEKSLYKLRLRNVQEHFYTHEPLNSEPLVEDDPE
jgi:hypothetical protein